MKGGETLEGGVMTMPHPVYADEVYRFFELIAQEHWADRDYGEKAPHEILEDPERLTGASVAEIRALLTYCARGEKFCDGHWEQLLKEGKVAAVLKRLKVLRWNVSRSPGRGRGV